MGLVVGIILGVVAFLAVGGVIVWQLFGPGPIRGRILARANNLLKEGDWGAALDLLEPITHQQLTPAWQERVDKALGDAYDLATEQALKDKRYEEALEHALKAAPFLRVKEDEQRTRVVDTMLAEVRRLFCVAESGTEVTIVQDLITRVFLLQSVCAEASFWLGLCLIRQNKTDEALRALTTAHEQVGKQYIDPALYLGMLYHSLGKPQDALKCLGEASRVDGTCPFVTFQMGLSAVAAGGDPLIALKSLQRATGPKGLSIWLKDQARAWVEAFPEARSFVRKAANRNKYTCPVLGSDLNVIIRAGLLAQAQAHYRLEQFQESADIYARLLENTPPSAGLLRGLGLSLARLGRYDQAYKHLRTSLELDEAKDSFTAGYLALCGAMGKPTNADDRPKNISWAIKLLARYQNQNTGNAEWASIYSRVFNEARGLHMAIAKEDQQLLCNVLASVQAHDPMAADGYLHLARTDKAAVAAIHAWLYCRAAVANEMVREGDLILFERTFQEPAPAKGFFERQKWNFDDVEYAYLHRAAVHQAGQWPDLLGPDYPKQGEAFLLKRSEAEEAAKKPEAAIRAVEILLRLAPKNTKGLDRLACLAFRKGELDKAVQLLERWRAQEPTSHWPLVRQAVIEEQRGNRFRRDEVLTQALGMTRGPVRAAVAYLGARLTLREAGGTADADFGAPIAFLEECLRDEPDHPQALWVLAALRSLQGNIPGLIEMAPRMTKADVTEPRYHLMGALCCLTAKQYAPAFEAGQRAAKEPTLQVEAYFILGLALMHVNKLPEAIQVFTKVANNEKAAAAPLAKALLGKLSYDRSAYEDTIKWWNSLDQKARAGWGIDEPLKLMVYLAGLTALQTGQFEQAAERFREAGKLGLREKRLGGLINLALIKAGQKLLFEDDKRK